MRMEWVNLGGTNAVLFLLPPNFATDIKVSLSVMDMAQVTQNNKSSTRSFISKGRYTVEMSCLCGNTQESTDIRQGLNRLKGELVALPLWTDSITLTTQTNAGDTTSTYSFFKAPARYGTAWIFVNLTTFIYEYVSLVSIGSSVATTSAPALTWPVGSILVPLIFGRFSPSARPTFTKLTESVNTVKFTFEENSPFTKAIDPFPSFLGTVGTTIGLAVANRLWIIPCTYSGAETDTSVVDIDYERIGFGRQDAQFVYPQAPRRVTELAFELCDRLTIAAIESCFIDRQGRANNIWVPTYRNDVDLLETLPDATPTHITVDGTSRYLDINFTTHPGYPYLCLNDNTGQAIWPFKIASIAGNVITTTVAIGQSWQQNAKISALILSRFQEPTIQWTYHSDGYASTTIKWVEATEDYQNTPYQQSITQLYAFGATNGGVTTSWFYTSFESSIVYGGNTYIPGLFSHNSIKTGIDMSSDEAEIASFIFSGNPLMQMMPWTLNNELFCNIYDYDRVTTAASLLFTGTVEELDTEGPKITAKVLGFGGLYDQQFHRHIMAGDCPYAVYSPECGTPLVFITRTITGAGSTQNIVSTALIGVPDNYYINGIMTVTAGAPGQSIMIVASSASGGTTVFQLARPINGTAIGCTVNLSIGCDGTVATCQNNFNNLINFGGEANVPLTNPSVAAMKAQDSSGNKK